MNVIISNKGEEVLSSLQIDVIKKVHGEYTADEIISMFENLFYSKMILDITAVKDYKDAKNIQKISMSLDADKLILYLDGSDDTSSSEYISKIISMGIYNFTKNKEGIMVLIERPNTYRDVAQLQQIEDKVTIMTRDANSKTKVLGIQNLTMHAGSTTLTYMIKRQLQQNYTVAALEINKRDFAFLNDKNMISTTSEELGTELLKLNGNVDVVLIDLNDSNQEKACNEVIYLIEPSIIRLNKFISRNREVLATLGGKKIILNKSLLTPKDVSEFEVEAGIKIFYSIPPLNDRVESKTLDGLLVKLGFLKQRVEEEQTEKQSKIFGIFKHRS